MRVDGSNGSNTIETIARLQAHSKSRPARTASRATASAPETSTDSAPAAPAESSGRARGVLQHIQEGHFHGTADVRLRINFAEELQGIQGAAASALLGEGLPALQDELNAAIDAFAASGELSEEQAATLRAAQDAFNTRVGALLGGGGGDSTGPTEVFAELRTAFQDFLNALVPPQPEEDVAIVPLDPPVDPVSEATAITAPLVAAKPEEGVAIIRLDPPVDPVGEATATTAPLVASSAAESITTGIAGTASDSTAVSTGVSAASAPVVSGAEPTPATDLFAGLRETLRGIFEKTITSLQDSVDALALPPLSEPHGNGRAFEKFLAIYNERYGIGGAATPVTPDVGIDTIT